MAYRKIIYLDFLHVRFTTRLGYFCWYWSITLNVTGDVLSGTSLMPYCFDIVYIVWVHSCVVFWFLYLLNHDKASAYMYICPVIYLIYMILSLITNLHTNSLSVSKTYIQGFMVRIYIYFSPNNIIVIYFIVSTALSSSIFVTAYIIWGSISFWL